MERTHPPAGAPAGSAGAGRYAERWRESIPQGGLSIPLRVLITLPFLFIFTLVLGVPSLVLGLFNKSAPLIRRISRLWARVVVVVWGLDVRLLAAENLPAGPALYAANHTSVMDTPVLFAALPVDFRMIHKRSLYRIPLVGIYLYLCGHIGIDRANAFRAKRSLEHAARRIRDGMSVVVFPEGTRATTKELGPFKRGSFVLALDAGVPVVPVSIRGLRPLVEAGVLRLKPGIVEVQIGTPISTQARDAEALADETRERVREACSAS